MKNRTHRIGCRFSQPLETGRRSGFALIIALSLMAFILLLLLSLTSLVRVETRSAETGLKRMQARQNAVLGLQIGLGELQAAAGPDQRITAPAELLVDTEDGRGRWTGVWRSPLAVGAAGDPLPEPDEATPEPAVLAWLVSGNEDVAPGDPFPEGPDESVDNTELQDGNVWLLGDAADAREPKDRVQLPARSVDASGENHYAWWVGDEGVKARIDVAEPPPAGAEADEYILAYRTGPSAVVEGMSAADPSPGGGTPLEGVFDGRESLLARLATYEGLPLIDPGDATLPALAQRLEDDLTVYSRGLLTNTRDGGLREDLSLAFEDDAEFDAFVGRHGEQIVPGAASGADKVARVPEVPGLGLAKWEQLRAYYRLHEQVSDGGANASLDLSANLPLLHQTDDQSAVYPVMVQGMVWSGLSSYPAGPPDQRGIRWWLFPGIVMWNPYNVSLEVPELYVRLILPRNSGQADDLERGIATFLYQEKPAPASPRVQYANSDTAANRPFGSPDPPFQFRIPAASYAPGELKVFSAPLGHAPMNHGSVGDTNDLVEGNHPGFGFWMDWPGTLGTFDASDPDQEFQLRLNAGGRVVSWRIATGPDTADFYDRDSLVHAVAHVHANQNLFLWPYRPSGNDAFPQDNAGAPPNEPYPFPSTSNAAFGGVGVKTTLLFMDEPLDPEPFPAAYDFDDPGMVRMRYLADFNPRAHAVGRTEVEWGTGSSNGTSNPRNWISRYLRADLGNYSSIQGLPGAGMPSNLTSFPDRGVLFDLPRQAADLQSLGQFQHANLSYDEGFRDFHLMDIYRHANAQPGYAIGNSQPAAYVPTDQTTAGMTGNETGASYRMYDHSHLLNRRLWDGFFLSTYRPGTDPALANRRLSWAGDEPPAAAPGAEEIAGELFVEGAFNVNSTSVEAWTAVLAMALDVDVETTSLDVAVDTDETAIPRLNYPGGEPFGAGGDPADPENLEGFRKLTAEQVRELAAAIVTEIRERRGDHGPFLSLGEFVNRSIDPGDPLPDRLRGTLQAAIDRTSVNGGDGKDSLMHPDFFVGDYIEDAGAGSVPPHPDYLAENQRGSASFGTPGFLTQADLLARLGPFLGVRSDTFRIRAYGEHRDPVGGEVSEAWCEAIVQRQPEYVDASANAPSAENRGEELSDANAAFGRKFRIVGFRWLEEDER